MPTKPDHNEPPMQTTPSSANPAPDWLSRRFNLPTERRSRLGWLVLRLTLAGLIAVHGWARWAGGVVPFGTWLDGQGWPAGLAIAITITALEIIGSALFAFGRSVSCLAIAFSAIYAMGIVLVHAKAGWFVVGLGRNGAEYSVLLIVCLLMVGLQHLPQRTEST
jgi:putative oxidoreductase